MTEAFLHCAGVRKRFGPIVAVDAVDLEVPRGQIMALVGPSGCGKTTLLRLIAGFERPDEGRIELGGRLLADGRRTSLAPERRRVGLVFQDYALFPHLSVEANIAFGVPRGTDKRRRTGEMLELVGLAGMRRRMPHELSGGQQQRVALARTLAAQPELVLLDEPFSNLDPGLRARVRSEVWQILAELGTTAIFVTHDQEEALSLPGDVGVMLDGRLHQVGPAEEVYRHPVDRRVAEFVGDANFLPGVGHGSMVECELGTMTARARGEVDVMLRPESIAISEAGGLPARVVAAEYYGHDQVVVVELPSGRRVKVRTFQGGIFAPGAEVGLRVTGEAAAFPRGE